GVVRSKGGLDRGMQMEAHREIDARLPGQPVLAAEVVAVGGQVELAGVAEAEAPLVKIVLRHDPMMAAFFGALALNGSGILAEPPVCLDLARVRVADAQPRRPRAGARDAAPGRFRAAIAAAIDDDALALATQLEGQHAGMRLAVEAVRRRHARIDQHERLPGL